MASLAGVPSRLPLTRASYPVTNSCSRAASLSPGASIRVVCSPAGMFHSRPGEDQHIVAVFLAAATMSATSDATLYVATGTLP